MVELFAIIIVVLILDALVSASEAALLSVSESKVAAALEKGKRGAKVLAELKADVQRPLASLIILSNIITIIGASVVGAVAIERFGSVVTGLVSALFTALIIVFAEVVPKIIGERHAEGVSLAFAGMLKLAARVFDPLIRFTYHLASLFSREKAPGVSEEEIAAMATLGASSGTIEADEAAMIREVFRLNDITARDLMTPRKKVFYLEGSKTLQELKEKIIAAKHSRIPVVDGHLFDTVVGIAHQRDLLIALEQGRGGEFVRTFVKKPLFVPTQIKADELLREFQKARMHLAVVVNEHGEVSGVVTLEDCLEELIGEIIDEKDVVPELIKRVSKDVIVVHGETKGRYINSLFQTVLPEAKTLTSFLQQQFHRIPQKGEVLRWKDLELQVEEGSAGNIERIRITRKPEEIRGETPKPPSTGPIDGTS